MAAVCHSMEQRQRSFGVGKQINSRALNCRSSVEKTWDKRLLKCIKEKKAIGWDLCYNSDRALFKMW